MRYIIKVKHGRPDQIGKYYLAPGCGLTPNREEAHRYTAKAIQRHSFINSAIRRKEDVLVGVLD